MKFKVGDKVKVRDDLQLDWIYNDTGFVYDMQQYRGSEVTISDVDKDGYYRIEQDEGKHYWGEDMFEPIENKEQMENQIVIHPDKIENIISVSTQKNGIECNILGTKYKIYKEVTPDQNKKIEPVDGFCDTSTKEIWIAKFEDCIDAKADLKEHEKKVIRHEIVHAFMYESGLDVNSSGCCSWANNEEMIDWFAIQSPKIFEVYKTLNLI